MSRSLFLFLLFLVSRGVAQTFTSSNLPIIVINTNGQFIPNEPKITADMGIIDNGPGKRNNATDLFNNYSGKVGIEMRGSSSQDLFPKKQYGVELRDELGNGISASLLGMPAEEDWVLFAPYNDKSLMRDVLAYKLGRDLGRYAPRTRYCELVLDGQYQGIYVLIEKIKRDNNRVDIARLDPTENTGDDLTGGYLLKIDKSSGSDIGGWFSQYQPLSQTAGQRIFFQYDYPKASEISQQQRDYIRNFMANFEAVLNSSTYNDPFNGYSKYINTESFIDYFIMNEITKNVDGYRLSTYMYKDKDSNGGKLHMGPIWDFNLGFGNADYCIKGGPEGWVTNYNSVCPQDYWLIPFWWDRLYQDSQYKNKLGIRWAQLRENILSTTRIHAYIDSVALALDEAQQRNFQRWPVLNKYIWPNYYVGPTYQSEVAWLKSWVTDRMRWLDTNMPKGITAVNDNQTELFVVAMPNPFVSQIQFNYSIASAGVVNIELIDVMGRSVISQSETHEQAGSYQSVVHTPQLKSGFYYYRVNAGNAPAVTGKLLRID